VSAGRRIGVSAFGEVRLLFETANSDQEVSTELMTLLQTPTRRYADTPIRSQAAGLVSGTPDPTDGRQTILSLTAACREWIKAGRAAKEDWLFRAIRTKLASGEQEELATAVELLKRLVDP